MSVFVLRVGTPGQRESKMRWREGGGRREGGRVGESEGEHATQHPIAGGVGFRSAIGSCDTCGGG